MKKLKTLFCKHKWIFTIENPKISLDKNESTMFIRSHKCKKCGKEKMINEDLYV